MERSSRVLKHWNPKSWFFFFLSSKLTKLNFFVHALRKEIALVSSISVLHYVVIDTSMERSSRVLLLQLGNRKIWFFFQENLKLNFDLYFDLCWRAEIIQVGFNMHLYVDIGDASSFLRGSTSSFRLVIICFLYLFSFLNNSSSIISNT